MSGNVEFMLIYIALNKNSLLILYYSTVTMSCRHTKHSCSLRQVNVIKHLDKCESATKLAHNLGSKNQLSETGKRTLLQLSSFVQNICRYCRKTMKFVIQSTIFIVCTKKTKR